MRQRQRRRQSGGGGGGGGSFDLEDGGHSGYLDDDDEDKASNFDSTSYLFLDFPCVHVYSHGGYYTVQKCDFI